MALRGQIAEAASAARHRTMVPFAALVFAAAIVVAAFAGRWLTSIVQLPFHSESGIIGWVTVHRYSKSQEVFNLAVAVIGLPLTLLAAWWGWIVSAAWGSRFAGCAPARLLRQLALTGAATFALVPTLARLEVTSLRPLLFVLAGLALASVLLVVLNRLVGTRSASAESDASDASEPTKPPRVPLAVPSARSRVLRRALVWVALPAFVYWVSFDGRLDNDVNHFAHFHEGERLYPTWVMRHGGVPYRDVYMQHGFFRNALVSRVGAAVFSPTLEGQRRMEDLLWPLGKVSVYFAGAALLGSKPLAALILAFLLLSSRVELSERFMFAGLALAVMAGTFRRFHPLDLLRPPYAPASSTSRLQNLARFLKKGWPLMISGALASLAFWTSVDTGLFAWTGMLAFLAAVAVLGPGGSRRARLGPMLAFALGAFAGFWMVGVYFVWHGAVYELLRNVYQQCAYQTETWGLPFPKLLDIEAVRDQAGKIDWGKTLQGEAIQMYFPFVCLLLAEASLVWLWVRGNLWTSRRGWRLLMLTCVGLVFARGLLGRSDSWHMYNGMLSQVLIFVLALDATLGFIGSQLRARRFRLGLLTTSLGTAALLVMAGPLFGEPLETLKSIKARVPAVWTSLGTEVHLSRSKSEPFPGAGRISIPEREAESIGRMVAFIQDNTRPGEAVINFSDFATLMAFADRPSAARYFMPCYMSTRAMQHEALMEIEKHRPRLAYRGLDHDCFDGPSIEERQSLIHDYLSENYEPLGRVEDIEFLWRKGEEPRPARKGLQISVDANRDYQIESASAGKCFQFAGDPSADGRELQVHRCTDSAAQRFRFDPLPDGAFKIRLADSKKCVDVEGWSQKDGAAVKGFTCHGLANQAWRILGVGTDTVRLVVQHSGKVLDVWLAAGADASPVKQMVWNDVLNQQFRLRLLEREQEAR
jgi:hypothetical protein